MTRFHDDFLHNLFVKFLLILTVQFFICTKNNMMLYPILLPTKNSLQKGVKAALSGITKQKEASFVERLFALDLLI